MSASVDVVGRATDAHLATWDLDLACGSSSAWTRLASRTHPVPASSFLARWDTSRAPPGECRLRLGAEDRAGNRSLEAFATATVERGDLLESLSATPDIFSPNGDGRRETATLGYTLRRAARAFFEVRDSKGRVRAFETGEERAAGAWSHVWDGTRASGEPAADGPLVLWVRAEDPAVPTVYEEKTIRFELDRTPPRIAISRPAADAFVSPQATVRGSVQDRNLALYTVSASPAGSGAVELVRATQGSSADGDLAPLSALAEGPHVLHVAASDRAENAASLDVPFLVDATPPRALIQSPARGAFLRRGEAPVAVVGLVRDDHLESWTLRFGAGAEPAEFATIAVGQTGGEGISLGAWDVRFVPDGVYTLSLVAVDRGGLSAESRVVVTLDGLAPTTTLLSPREGGYVSRPGPVLGAVADANLVGWDLEVAPGAAATAYQWLPLGSGKASVDGGALAEWSPLPPDGVYTLRLTARDEVGLTASTRSAVTVDTTPPAAPTGLAAKVTRGRDGYGRVEVTWNANTEEDLAGYRVERPRAAWGALLGSPAWDDGERLEGRYTYRVLAEDRAGNQSPPATLQVLVDLTPPLVSFSFPAADARVAGALDVRGTAHSADDFAEFRLFVGAGENPVAWTLLRRSSVPVAGGKLGEWLALVDGPHVLALEAEDTSGNEARATRRVVVDTLPPEPPVLVAVAKAEAPADRLVPSWQPSPSEDVAGTLVYRNGRLANSTSIVVGDKTGFLVPGTSYEDLALPDGEHCYRVVAVDGAGNESVPSNEICQSLDNRAPRALVVHPPDGTRFGYPVRVAAETPDLDVASVRFERRVPGAPAWTAFGEARSAPPWETTLDPRPAGGEELPAGAHELRAVATDRAGNTDPDPESITVTYGDTTAPPAPAGLVARVDGADVALAWTPVDAADLAAYRVYRDGERIAEGLVEPRHVDAGLDPGTYEYAVTAVDEDGNESAPSAPAGAVVYVLRLDSPDWPVAAAPLAPVSGDGSRPQTTVKVLREGSSVAEGPGTGGPFRIAAVPLAPEGNLLRARGEDAAGNRSVPSNEVVVIENRPPGAVSGLGAEVDGKAVALTWTAVPDADVVGYVVRRDGERLTQTLRQSVAASIVATSRSSQAALAFDGNPSTAWVPEAGSAAAWTVTFPAPVLVERLHLRFAKSGGTGSVLPAAYTLLARWQDRDLKIARVRGNDQVTAEHRLPSPFLTTAIRVDLESPGGLAEVVVEGLDVVPAGVLTFDDEGVADGRHAYTVAAIDRYGAEGEAGTVEAAVGDVDPPGPPTGLVAKPVVRDVHLTWNPSPEPDVTGYVVLRDGARVGTAAAPAWLDPGRPNGTYRYAVIAVDAAGHESGASAPADATVDVQPVPPAAPVILEPTDAAHPLTLGRTSVDVAGRADAGLSRHAGRGRPRAGDRAFRARLPPGGRPRPVHVRQRDRPVAGREAGRLEPVRQRPLGPGPRFERGPLPPARRLGRGVAPGLLAGRGHRPAEPAPVDRPLRVRPRVGAIRRRPGTRPRERPFRRLRLVGRRVEAGGLLLREPGEQPARRRRRDGRVGGARAQRRDGRVPAVVPGRHAPRLPPVLGNGHRAARSRRRLLPRSGPGLRGAERRPLLVAGRHAARLDGALERGRARAGGGPRDRTARGDRRDGLRRRGPAVLAAGGLAELHPDPAPAGRPDGGVASRRPPAGPPGHRERAADRLLAAAGSRVVRRPARRARAGAPVALLSRGGPVRRPGRPAGPGGEPARGTGAGPRDRTRERRLRNRDRHGPRRRVPGPHRAPRGHRLRSPGAGRRAGRPAARPGRERRGQRRVRAGGPRARARPGGRGRPRHAGHAAARAGGRRGFPARALDSGRGRPLHGPGRGRPGRPRRRVFRDQQRRRARGPCPRRGGARGRGDVRPLELPGGQHGPRHGEHGQRGDALRRRRADDRRGRGRGRGGAPGRARGVARVGPVRLLGPRLGRRRHASRPLPVRRAPAPDRGRPRRRPSPSGRSTSSRASPCSPGCARCPRPSPKASPSRSRSSCRTRESTPRSTARRPDCGCSSKAPPGPPRSRPSAPSRRFRRAARGTRPTPGHRRGPPAATPSASRSRRAAACSRPRPRS